jgi:hypothetical protein
MLRSRETRKVMTWRDQMVARKEEGKGEDGVVRVTWVLLPRVSIVPSEEMDPDIAAALAQISQVNTVLRASADTPPSAAPCVAPAR